MELRGERAPIYLVMEKEKDRPERRGSQKCADGEVRRERYTQLDGGRRGRKGWTETWERGDKVRRGFTAVAISNARVYCSTAVYRGGHAERTPCELSTHTHTPHTQSASTREWSFGSSWLQEDFSHRRSGLGFGT